MEANFETLETILTINSLEFVKIKINEDYRKKWNIIENDYFVIRKDGELISNTLYRIGGFGISKGSNYFMILKHKEAFYDKEIVKGCKNKDLKHLADHWVIMDCDGNEKVECGSYKSPYLVKNSCVYSIDKNYYNIETGEFYCGAYSEMESKDYLFLDNKFDKDFNKRGVMKINKIDGSYEIFSSK